MKNASKTSNKEKENRQKSIIWNWGPNASLKKKRLWTTSWMPISKRCLNWNPKERLQLDQLNAAPKSQKLKERLKGRNWTSDTRISFYYICNSWSALPTFMFWIVISLFICLSSHDEIIIMTICNSVTLTIFLSFCVEIKIIFTNFIDRRWRLPQFCVCNVVLATWFRGN